MRSCTTESPVFSFCALSDIGLNRPTNQDAWAADPEVGFFALADGMGGRRAGDVAAKETLQTLLASVQKLFRRTNFLQDSINLKEELRELIEQANRRVFGLGQSNKQLLGMGTTLCCLLFTKEVVYLAHVGDSRIYRFRDGHLELMTRDHSLLERWLAKNQFTNPTPPKNIITRAIGTNRLANPEIAFLAYRPGDLFFLSSDGLTDVLGREQLQKIILSAKTLESAVEKMIARAKKLGSGDNITVLMISYGSDLSR